MYGISTQVLLISGYAVFLTMVAACLEVAARHSHHRTRRSRTVGFLYQPELDMWKCPNGKNLYRAEVVRESTVVRYRAEPHHCNSCPIKNRCTDSEEGRVIEVESNSWVRSELRRFHRGLSLTLFLLADLMVLITLITQSNTSDEVLLGTLLFCITGVGIRLAARFFHSDETKSVPASSINS